MNRNYDDETGELNFSIPSFPIRAHVVDLGHTGVQSIQLQDAGGTVASYFADDADAEATATKTLFEYYRDNAA